MADGYPEVPEAKLEAGGWKRQVRTEEAVFETPAASVIGSTLLYEDAALREALDTVGAAGLLETDGDSGSLLIDTGEADGYWRFFFATALSFRPPLAPGIGPASIRPTVAAEARRSFETDLQARGFENVDRGRRQRVRTESGDRAGLWKVTASYPFEDAPTDALDVEGWLAVWTTGGSFRIAGGAYPIRGLLELLGELDPDERPGVDPGGYREELLELIRAVR